MCVGGWWVGVGGCVGGWVDRCVCACRWGHVWVGGCVCVCMCVRVGVCLCMMCVCVCVCVLVLRELATNLPCYVAGLLNTSPQQPAPSSRAHWLPTGQLRARGGTHGNH